MQLVKEEAGADGQEEQKVGEETGENEEIDNMLCDLIDIHKVKGNEEALHRVLRSIYSQLDGGKDIKFGTKLYDKLISVVIADRESVHVNREQLAKILNAVQTHVRQFPTPSLCLLRRFASVSLLEKDQTQLHPHAGQILEHLLDDFVRELGLEYTCSPQLFAVIQDLLQAEQCESRQLAYAIMRKLLANLYLSENQKDSDMPVALKYVELHWAAYIAIMEQLEQHEAHLVLPMLSWHLTIFKMNAHDPDWLKWLEILNGRLLDSDNKLVIRWTLEYFLFYFGVSTLGSINLLMKFLNTVNRTELYDMEEYLLPKQNINAFVQNSGTLQFLEAFAAVSWHSLPLLHWLRSMQPRQPHVDKELLLKICERVGCMQHETLRYEAQNRMFDIFELTIENLSLGDYIQFMKAMCSTGDNICRDHKRFTAKIASCMNIADEMVHFDKALFTMLYRTDINMGIELHKQLSKLPPAQHGWWRLFSFFFCLKLESACERLEIMDFYHDTYDLDVNVMERFTDLGELQQFLLDRLHCESEEEKTFVRHRSVDWFTCEKLIRWDQLEQLHLNPNELIGQGTILTAQRIATLMNESEVRLADESVLRSLVNCLKQWPDNILVVTAIVKYAAAHWPVEESDQLLNEVLEATQFHINVLRCTRSVPTSLLIRGILAGIPLTGEKCIEYRYLTSQYNYMLSSCQKRDAYINFVSDGSTEAHPLLEELLRINNEMGGKSQQQQHHAEYSREHRIKIRIARALLRITYKQPGLWSEQLWTALLAPHEQESIRYMYECLVARCLPSVDLLLERLHQLAALNNSQQLSLISVLHIFSQSKSNWTKLEPLRRIYDILLPLTMSKDSEISIFSQLVLHRLLLLFDDRNVKMKGCTMAMALECTLGPNLLDCQHQGRLLLPKICYQTPDGLQVADFILYMTHAPCDEYFADALRPHLKLKSELGKYRSGLRGDRASDKS